MNVEPAIVEQSLIVALRLVDVFSGALVTDVSGVGQAVWAVALRAQVLTHVAVAVAVGIGLADGGDVHPGRRGPADPERG